MTIAVIIINTYPNQYPIICGVALGINPTYYNNKVSIIFIYPQSITNTPHNKCQKFLSILYFARIAQRTPDEFISKYCSHNCRYYHNQFLYTYSCHILFKISNIKHIIFTSYINCLSQYVMTQSSLLQFHTIDNLIYQFGSLIPFNLDHITIKLLTCFVNVQGVS